LAKSRALTRDPAELHADFLSNSPAKRTNRPRTPLPHVNQIATGFD
jgi:hypothetical protein